MLEQYTWPGNISRTYHLMERVSISKNGQEAHNIIKEHIHEMQPLARRVTTAPPPKNLTHEDVLSALTQANGNKKKAAQISGVQRSTLYRLP